MISQKARVQKTPEQTRAKIQRNLKKHTEKTKRILDKSIEPIEEDDDEYNPS